MWLLKKFGSLACTILIAFLESTTETQKRFKQDEEDWRTLLNQEEEEEQLKKNIKKFN